MGLKQNHDGEYNYTRIIKTLIRCFVARPKLMGPDSTILIGMKYSFWIEMSAKAGHLSHPTKTESASDKVSYYEL